MNRRGTGSRDARADSWPIKLGEGNIGDGDATMVGICGRWPGARKQAVPKILLPLFPAFPWRSEPRSFLPQEYSRDTETPTGGETRNTRERVSPRDICDMPLPGNKTRIEGERGRERGGDAEADYFASERYGRRLTGLCFLGGWEAPSRIRLSRIVYFRSFSLPGPRTAVGGRGVA